MTSRISGRKSQSIFQGIEPLQRRAVAGVLISFMLVACNTAPQDTPADEIQQRLVGNWLREYDQEGARIRRLLVLEADGRFSETAVVIDPDGAFTEHAHAGQWTFDGINLKRRYSSFNGKKPHAPTLPFATFAIRFVSKQEFVGIDNLRKREVRYQRVEQGAAL